jgi:hypothetical protein
MYFIHPDHLNTPRVITDQVGNEVWRWDNAEAFGSNPPNEDPGNIVVWHYLIVDPCLDQGGAR